VAHAARCSSVSVTDLRRLQTHEAGIARLLANSIVATFANVHQHHVGGADAGPWGQQGPSALTTAPPRRPAAPPACRKEAGAQLKRVADAPLPLAPRCRQQLRLGARRAGCGLLPPGRAPRGTVLQPRRARGHGHGGPWQCVVCVAVLGGAQLKFRELSALKKRSFCTSCRQCMQARNLLARLEPGRGPGGESEDILKFIIII